MRGDKSVDATSESHADLMNHESYRHGLSAIRPVRRIVATAEIILSCRLTDRLSTILFIEFYQLIRVRLGSFVGSTD
jgi:hypothetical protein